ncbi:MAG: hypothetical protein KC563_13165 [Nitrospira sp.]|nr:hypothetical protein [Nitrospira sp.]MCA9476737.1 hypothetical protein [Nitrospira sp.]MCA9480484.1 hypothetical protein [Nitrospira sp.]MCB9712025.1 hypothetical protein [Nitrospiraceae bacterium]
MNALSSIIIRLALLITLLLTYGCSDSGTAPAGQEPKSEQPGFTAKVSGAVNAEVSGVGIVTYLGPKDRGIETSNRPGYFLIANLNNDLTKENKFTITFRIPDKAKPGNHPLVTSDPLKIGEHFEVRVETVEAGKPILYQTNTKGTITLDQFSPDRTSPSISNINGTFQFVTENADGHTISANGTFDFPLRRNIASYNSSYTG